MDNYYTATPSLSASPSSLSIIIVDRFEDVVDDDVLVFHYDHRSGHHISSCKCDKDSVGIL